MSLATEWSNRIRGDVLQGEPLAAYSTYRVGGPAAILVKPAVPEDVAVAVRAAKDTGQPWLALGLGSNVLVADAGFPGIVIRMGGGLDHLVARDACWTAGAGLPTPLLAKRTAAAGWAGAHPLVGVPGTVGGGVFMNAGCHGADFASIVERVLVIDAAGRERVIPRRGIPFRYRQSGLDQVVVVEATVRLREGDPDALQREQRALFRWRKAGTPFDQPCGGSVFRNPPGELTAGRLVDAAGLKGARMGGAQVSPMHANYIVNTGAATAHDVRRLIDHVQKTVFARSGIALELELQLVGG